MEATAETKPSSQALGLQSALTLLLSVPSLTAGGHTPPPHLDVKMWSSFWAIYKGDPPKKQNLFNKNYVIEYTIYL